jgi:hypothetical protein
VSRNTRGRGPAEPQKPLLPLHPDEERALNRAFYAPDPASYFDLRLRRVFELAATTDANDRSAERRLEHGGIAFVVPSVASEPADEHERQQFVAIESEMLVHHVAETVLRLYFAHRDSARVPWVELANMRAPGDFKRAANEILDPDHRDALREGIGFVWLGNREPVEGEESEWDRGVSRLLGYLQAFATLLTVRAPLYNAAKHGLGLQLGDRKMSIKGIQMLNVEGPSLAWLSQVDGSDGREWSVKSRWTNFSADTGMVFGACVMLRGLWTVARCRYLGWPLPQDGIPLPRDYTQIRKAGGRSTEAVVVNEIALPPTIFSPPGTGADAELARSAHIDPRDHDAPEEK